MGRDNVTDQELADLVERTAEAASALIRGDIRSGGPSRTRWGGGTGPRR